MRHGMSGRKFNRTKEHRKAISKSLNNNIPHIHTDETRKKISESMKGSGNSQYGTMWITDGNNNKKIKKDQKIPENWTKGRNCPRNSTG